MPLKTLAVFHNFDQTWVYGIAAGLGRQIGVQCSELAEAKYLVRTHDEPVEVGGILGWGEKRLRYVRPSKNETATNDGGAGEQVRLVDLDNGESFVLE